MKRVHAFCSADEQPAKKARPDSQRRMIVPELKFLDTYLTAQSLGTTVAGSEVDPATFLCLNAIAQGDGESNRDGRQVVVKSINIRGDVSQTAIQDQADARASTVVRLLLVKDKQTNGAQLNAEDVLLDTSGLDVHSHRNLQYEQRFEVLWDKTIQLDFTTSQSDGVNTASTAGQKKPFHIYKKLDMPVNFTDTTAVVGSIADNSLHLIALATVAGSCTISYQARCRFFG